MSNYGLESLEVPPFALILSWKKKGKTMIKKLKRFIMPFVLTVNRFGYIELMTNNGDGTISGTDAVCSKPFVTTHNFWMKWRLHAFVAKDDIKNLQEDTEKAYSGTWYMQ